MGRSCKVSGAIKRVHVSFSFCILYMFFKLILFFQELVYVCSDTGTRFNSPLDSCRDAVFTVSNHKVESLASPGISRLTAPQVVSKFTLADNASVWIPIRIAKRFGK
jgi:hypothetical protein